MYTAIIILISALFTGCITDVEYGDLTQNDILVEDVSIGNNISIACWNLHIFGPSKASNETLLRYYEEHLDDHDIFISQEIRNATVNAVNVRHAFFSRS